MKPCDAENEILPPEQIQRLVRSFQESRVMLTAFELGIFTVLEQAPQTSAQVAAKLDTNDRATDRLLNALIPMGLVNKNNGVFSNAPAASTYLVAGKPCFLKGIGHANNLWDAWSNLTGAIIRNPKKAAAAKKKKEDSWYDVFIAAMDSRAITSAPPIIAQLDLDNVRRVLDVGGGSGAFSVQFVKQGKDLKATVFDQPQVVKMTQTYVAKAGLSGKIDFIAGDYTKDSNFGDGYDLVFLSAIIHSNSSATNRALFDKCYGALNHGGRIVVNDFIMDDERVDPAMGTLFALNMLVATNDGDTYSEAEVRTWLAGAGFRNIQRLPAVGPAASMIGEKQM
jgi:precorrin-6B methylase 2